MNISILYGGTSMEHKISIQTGMAVVGAIKNTYDFQMVQLDHDINSIIIYPLALFLFQLICRVL